MPAASSSFPWRCRSSTRWCPRRPASSPRSFIPTSTSRPARSAWTS
eukprot:SM000054S18084  [mRNA]  locus=s54:278924:279179:- [translate_table: standard]